MTDPDKQLFDSIRSGDSAKIEQLLKTNPSLADAKNKDGVSAMVLALYHGRTEIALMLADTKRTPLDIFEACSIGDSKSVRRILSTSSREVNSYSPDGFTPLGLASHFGKREIVVDLLAKGADVNTVSKNPTGFTALTGALAGGHSEIARILVEKGADVNHRYEAGFSPLMIAAESGDLETVKILLAHGADPTATAKDGRSPLSIAEEKGHAQVASLLKSRLNVHSSRS